MPPPCVTSPARADSRDKEKLASKRFEATSQEVADEAAQHEADVVTYTRDINEATSEPLRAKAEIALCACGAGAPRGVP